jgi:hypothetical protein
MMAKMSSRDQLLLWTAESTSREDLADEAILFVVAEHRDVVRWTEEFYALVLARVLSPGK